MITMITIYRLLITPYGVVFPDVYEFCTKGVDAEGIKIIVSCDIDGSVIGWNENLKSLETLVDVIFLVEIIFNFLKKTKI